MKALSFIFRSIFSLSLNDVKYFAVKKNYAFLEVRSKYKINKKVDSSLNNGSIAIKHGKNSLKKSIIIKNNFANFTFNTILKLHQHNPKQYLLSFATCLTISECFNHISHSNFVKKHLSKRSVQLNDMMKTTTDRTSEILVFCWIETVYQHHQSVYLSKL